MLLGTLASLDIAAAQQVRTASLQPLFPTGAEIIETADLTVVIAKPRILALWMLGPQRNLDDGLNKNRAGGYCSDIIDGDFGKFWKGPTRLSLVDSELMKLINTVEIREGCPGCQVGRDSFTIPLCVLNPYSRVRNPVSDRAGKPNMNLRDLTGEGVKAEFALFIFEAFGIASTGVFGYEPKSDRVVQFAIEIQSSKKPLITLWTEQIFAREPVRPGYWNFTWEPGHGDPNTYSEEVSFDRRRLLFTQKTGRVPKTKGP